MRILIFSISILLGLLTTADAQYPGWKHSGSLFIMTTPEGADLPAGATVEDFPLLVRLHQDYFDFRQARTDGADLRFATSTGIPLPYQIEHWDLEHGEAVIWVRIPKIQGNARQELRLFWGNPAAESASSGSSVFDESNGFLSVWHLGNNLVDDTGMLDSKDAGTVPVAGRIGQARHFGGGQGVFGGDKILKYPTGSAPHTSSVWVRAEKPNGRILGWGNEQGQGKVVMQFRSPPHIGMDCYFSNGNVQSAGRLPMSEWIHVAHTYANGESRIYVNGAQDGISKGQGAPLNIRSPARLWIGGWYHNYDFVGDLDEVRIASVTRSSDWVKLEYENQKANQTLVGPVVRAGDRFTVIPSTLIVKEGQSVAVTAQADGAQKIYWLLQRDGLEAVVAVDRLHYTLEAGRVVGNQSARLTVKAVYPDDVRTIAIPVTIHESIPEPMFTLQVPSRWDGRQTIEVTPQISNLAAMQAAGAGDIESQWSVNGLATVREVVPGKLVLKRAMNSGELEITLSLSNGGSRTRQSKTINVTEPATDPWVTRLPSAHELPEDNQFYARDDKNEGTVHCTGTLDDTAEMLSLRLYADGKLITTEKSRPGDDKAYALSVKLKPGLIKYRVELVATNGDREAVLHTADELICGDAYLINGQSNAEATDVGKEDPPFSSEWIRTFGSPGGNPTGNRAKAWTNAVCRNRQGGHGQIGYWGLELARHLVETRKIPVCIINGAVGGTRIDQHQRNPELPDDPSTIYGRLLWRVREARLTHGIRGILWHQGENDQGADGPTGGYGWETYRDFFIDMAAGWQQDYPNVRNLYLFQIWPRSCSMGINGSDNMLREVQRTLPRNFSRMSVMSTLGIHPPGGCHFPPAGYAEFARLIAPLIERDLYDGRFAESITPPNLTKATWGDGHRSLILSFDQPVVWTEKLVSQFYLDGTSGAVAGGEATGNTLTLSLKEASRATRVTYLDSKSWSQDNLLIGANGIAALTFCNVAIAE